MPIVQSVAGQILDDVYLIEEQTPPSIQGVQVGIIGMVGAFQMGIPTGIYSVSSYPEAVRKLGKSAPGFGGPLALQNIIRQGAGNIQIVPAFGSDASTAKVDIYDAGATPKKLGTLYAAAQHPQTGLMTKVLGPYPNKWAVIISAGQNGTFNLVIKTQAGYEPYYNLTPANWAATINGQSSTVIAEQDATPSSLVAAPGTYSFSGGSAGAIDDAAYIGDVNDDGTRNGLSLLETITVNFIMVAETGSQLINAQLAVFGINHNCIPIMCAPVNSTASQTKTAKELIVQDNVAFCDGWDSTYDQDQGILVQAAPTGKVAGMVAALAPQKSFGNKRLYGSQGLLLPRNTPELEDLQQAGVLCLSNAIPRGGFGTRSGISADGVTDLYVRRMRYFLELSVMNSMGWAVDELQSTADNDPLRKKIKSTIDTFFHGLANPANPDDKVIDSYLVVCDKTNNPDDQIAAGKLSVTVKVRLLAAAKQIIISAEISPGTITIQSQAA